VCVCVCVYLCVCVCVCVYVCVCVFFFSLVFCYFLMRKGYLHSHVKYSLKGTLNEVVPSVCACVKVCCGVLQHVAVCCSVLQCVAACCRDLQCLDKRVFSLMKWNGTRCMCAGGEEGEG